MKGRRLALVTGGSRGIGAATAQLLAESGCDIIITYYASRQEADRVAQACRAKGVRAQAIRADVRDSGSLAALKARLDEQALSPDMFIHCAGTAHYSLLADVEEDVWDDLMNVHLKAAYQLTRLFAPAMTWRRWGRIVFMSSVWGVVGAAGEAAYAAAKGGLNAFAKSMARELASAGVTVNAIAAGAFDTDMMADLPADERAALVREIPLGRLGRPQEAAELVRYLVSDKAGYMTGQVISLGGGWRA